MNGCRQPLPVTAVDSGAAQNSPDICPDGLVQTLWYSSPEVVLECPYAEATGAWALGVTAAEAVLGNPPYPETKRSAAPSTPGAAGRWAADTTLLLS